MYAKWAALLALSSVLVRSAAVTQNVEAEHSARPTRLVPIKLANNGLPHDVYRRSAEDFSDLDLRTQSDLIYGSPGAHGQAVLANMTLYAPDGLQMIMMERFEGLTSAVDCDGDDGKMSLTFKSKKAFNYALKTWQFINEKSENKFLLIANHAGCGPDDQRQPYFITKVTEDAKHLTTYLAAKPAPWSEVAGSYDLHFGKPLASQNPKAHSKRGVWDDIKDGAGDVVDGVKHGAEDVANTVEDGVSDVANAVQGNIDLSKSITFGVNAGKPGQVTSIYKDSSGRFALDCINCFIQGSFKVSGRLNVRHFSIQDFSVDASPSNFLAELELRATASVTKKPEDLQYTKTLFSAPIPDAGIEVPEIFSLGAILSYDVGVSTSFKGSVSVDFGVKAQLPDSAKLVADIDNPGASSAVGFSGALSPIFKVDKIDASVTVAAFSQPKLSFGIEVNHIGKADVAITLKLPQVSATLDAGYEPTGFCTKDAGASKTGVTVDTQADIEVNLAIDAALKEDAKPVWSKKLFGFTQPIYSKCLPFNIPGLKGAAGSTSSASGTSPKSPSPSTTRKSTAASASSSAIKFTA